MLNIGLPILNFKTLKYQLKMEINFLKTTKPSLYEKLLEKDITSVQTVLLLDALELKKLLKITEEEVEDLKKHIALKFLPKPRLGNIPQTRISTGCEQIDAALQGGIPTAQTIEIFGCSGTGKTQFCLQLLLTIQLPFNLGGLNKSSVYICTEPPFPSKRFHEICELAPQKYNINKYNFEENVYITTCHDSDDFLKCLTEKLAHLMEMKNVGLIVVDTIAALFRGEKKEVNYLDRSLKFQEIIEKLRILSRKHDAALVIVNQVTDNPETSETGPALGHSWSKFIAQSLQISRKEYYSATRTFSIVSSHECAGKSAEFHITKEGIV